MKLRGMIKRALSVLLALSMVLSTTACSKKTVDTGLSDPTPQVIVENIETENIETENVLTEFITSEIYLEELILVVFERITFSCNC